MKSTDSSRSKGLAKEEPGLVAAGGLPVTKAMQAANGLHQSCVGGSVCGDQNGRFATPSGKSSEAFVGAQGGSKHGGMHAGTQRI